jgi:hypothetical protein
MVFTGLLILTTLFVILEAIGYVMLLKAKDCDTPACKSHAKIGLGLTAAGFVIFLTSVVVFGVWMYRKEDVSGAVVVKDAMAAVAVAEVPRISSPIQAVPMVQPLLNVQIQPSVDVQVIKTPMASGISYGLVTD